MKCGFAQFFQKAGLNKELKTASLRGYLDTCQMLTQFYIQRNNHLNKYHETSYNAFVRLTFVKISFQLSVKVSNATK